MSKRLSVLVALLLVLVVIAGLSWPGPTLPPKWAIDPPLTQPVAKKKAPPLKLFEGTIPADGAAELTVMANMA